MSDVEPAGDALSELAKRRRADVERESTRARPPFVQSVEQSEVVYSFDLSAMPFRQIDLVRLSAGLADAYGAQLDGPDFSPLLAVMPRDQLLNTSEEMLLQKLMRAPNPGTLRWIDGRFPLRDDFIAIRSIQLNFESIHVSVAGSSEFAEVVAQETMELIWKLSGSKKSYEKDLAPLVLLTAYGTRTRLQLDFGPEVLVNPVLMDFFSRNLTTGSAYARHMGRQKAGSGGTDDQTVAVAALDRLTIRVNRFNPNSGYSEEADLEFEVTGRSDYRSGRIVVTSSLPYDKHIELLTQLFEAVRPSSA